MIATAHSEESLRELCQRLAWLLVGELGLSCRRVAAMLQRPVSTVCRWIRRARDVAAGVVRRRPGRPRRAADRLTRNDVYATLQACGGRISDVELQRAYPMVGRDCLRRLKRRWRRLWARLRRRRLERLTWQRPGAIWATDFAELPGGVEELGKHLLVVRDLASGDVLDVAVCRRQDQDHVAPVIDRLFAQHGAPLVLKSDNGAAFVGGRIQLLLQQSGVLPLYSPPGTPAYNGGCEAAVGSVKSRSRALASRRGVAAGVTLDDLHGAITQIGNQPVRRRAGEPSRREAWLRRAPISAGMRAELQARVAQHRHAACRAEGIASLQHQPHAQRASIDRFAIGRALRELCYLMTRRADFVA